MNPPEQTPATPDPEAAARPGDVVFLFRQPEGSEVPPLLLQHAVLAALRLAGLLPAAADPRRDHRDIAEFLARGRMERPVVRRRGATGWNE
ncbi:hypothetical protein [Actinomadura sp. K4S16]|uniref:hypothetical protein n=1 Tax=Actinomadura sp. K4S16 TaxID=1316147 RepID=UPI0011EE6F3B|nr:hypothetical protein [Actinomadura sp. K4S16]